jgi:hypothetical protein
VERQVEAELVAAGGFGQAGGVVFGHFGIKLRVIFRLGRAVYSVEMS